MPVDVPVPTLGESITEATVLEWLVAPGQRVEVDQDLVELETDKVSVTVPAPIAGVLVEQVAGPDALVNVGDVIARIEQGALATSGAAPAASSAAPVDAPAESKPSPAPPALAAVAPPAAATPASVPSEMPLMPGVRRLIAEHGLDATAIPASGKGGRLLKEDVLAFVEGRTKPVAAAASVRPAPSAPVGPPPPPEDAAREEAVPMTGLRRRIAERLVMAQQNAAMLTTFNEIDMSATMALRKQYQDAFVKQHGVKLGFMSLFAKATLDALKRFPRINAEIRGNDIVYKNYYHMGIAVGGGRGLVVPVIRDADQMSFAEFEKALAELAGKARDNKLALKDLQGGTFTISNGGVYGSLLSTPILNPPQSGILGLHKIEKRPVAVGDKVEIRPMMYVALSYDHRIVDGREAVSFLVRIKEAMEDPSRMLIEV